MRDFEPARRRFAWRRGAADRAGRIGCIALAIAVGSGPRCVRAETPVPGASAGTSQSAAEALFVEAKRLIEKGSYADACAKFAESQRLGPAPGTLLNLADCYERNGQLASAWIAFRAATTASEQIGRTAWADQSSARARLLEPRLPTLTIEVDTSSAPPGLEVSYNAAAVERSTWGVPVPIDPSTASIEARAPNKKTWSTTVTIDAEHLHVVVAIPALESIPAPVVQAVRNERAVHLQWTPQRVAAASSAAAGVVVMGAALGLVVAAKVADNQAKEEPLSSATPDSTRANQEGNIATGLAIGGAVAAAAGIVLWLTAPKGRPRVTTSGPGLVLGGSF